MIVRIKATTAVLRNLLVAEGCFMALLSGVITYLFTDRWDWAVVAGAGAGLVYLFVAYYVYKAFLKVSQEVREFFFDTFR